MPVERSGQSLADRRKLDLLANPQPTRRDRSQVIPRPNDVEAGGPIIREALATPIAKRAQEGASPPSIGRGEIFRPSNVKQAQVGQRRSLATDNGNRIRPYFARWYR